MTSFYNIQRPVVENGKLIFISNGGSREFIGIRDCRKQLADLETKTNLRPSTQERLALLREGVATWERWKAAK